MDVCRYMTYDEAVVEMKASKSTIGRYKQKILELSDRYPRACVIGSRKLPRIWYPALVDYATNMTVLRDKNMRRLFNKQHPFEVTVKSGLCI